MYWNPEELNADPQKPDAVCPQEVKLFSHILAIQKAIDFGVPYPEAFKQIREEILKLHPGAQLH